MTIPKAACELWKLTNHGFHYFVFPVESWIILVDAWQILVAWLKFYPQDSRFCVHRQGLFHIHDLNLSL